MKLQATITYQLSEIIKSSVIFYAILFSALFIPAIWSDTMEFTGTEMATVIFIFVIGLNSFRANFLFAQANGVSRKTQFAGLIVTMLAISGVLAIVDIIYTTFSGSLLTTVSLFSMIYQQSGLFALSPVLLFLVNFTWHVLLYAMVALLGYFIHLVYYRSNLIMKLAVSIIPPVFFIFIVPYLVYANPAFARWISQLANLLLGFSDSPNPAYAMGAFGFFFVVFSFGSFLLIRRAPVK